MSELTRKEFIKHNFGRMHVIDVRATIGRLTMPTPNDTSPLFRPADVLQKFEGIEIADDESSLNHTLLSHEIKAMRALDMIHRVDSLPTAAKQGGGTYYERNIRSPHAAFGWALAQFGALTVAQLYPDAPQNKAWEDFVLPYMEKPTS